MDLYGKDLISTQEWSVEELQAVLGLAARMKADRFAIKMEIEGLPQEEKNLETP